MRRLLMSLLVLVLAVLVVEAADLPVPNSAPGDESFGTIKNAYDNAFQKFREERQNKTEGDLKAFQQKLAAAKKDVQDAKTDGEKQTAQKRLQKASQFPAMKGISASDGPGETFSPRFLAFALKHPKDEAVLDAIYMTLMTSGGPAGKTATWDRAVKALQTDHVGNPALKRGVRLFRLLARAHDEAADQVLRDVIDKNPDRHAKGRACKALAQGRSGAAELGEHLKSNTALRRNIEVDLAGKKTVEKLIAGIAEAKQEANELTRTLREKYDDVCPDLSVGKPVPKTISRDLDGKAVKLSDLKGSVVVLDFWATWCGPCRAMIPHEREMVGRLKDKAFVLVSISADQELETLKKFLDKERMPWTHWYNGPEGGINEDWDIQAYPTIYVLDANGVIRHKDLRGDKLEEAVNMLLKELEAKKP